MPEETKNIYQRMMAAQEEVSYIKKSRAKGVAFAIVNHDDVTAKLRPVLMKNGIHVGVSLVHYEVQEAGEDKYGKPVFMFVGTYDVVFTNVDNPEEKIVQRHAGIGLGSDDKGSGKACSYATKYGYLKALGLETGEDPDKDAPPEVNKKGTSADKRRPLAEKIREQIEGNIEYFITKDTPTWSAWLEAHTKKKLKELTVEQLEAALQYVVSEIEDQNKGGK